MKVLQTFINVVRENAFAQAHEELEQTWRRWKNDPLKREESYILKGLINGATALALITLNRPDSSKRVWETYEKYLPLIDTLPSENTPLYQEAKELLDLKYYTLKENTL